VLNLERPRGLPPLVEAGLLTAERERGAGREQKNDEDPHARY
jgi:hypothetical protein